MRAFNSDGSQRFGRNMEFGNRTREEPASRFNLDQLNMQLAASLPFHVDHHGHNHQGHHLNLSNPAFKILLLVLLLMILSLLSSDSCPAD